MAAPPLFHPGKELPILWESGHFVVIDKPAGLAAHPGPQTRDSVESRLLPQKRGGPWLVHRLDADTAGCLLIARRKSALIAAQKAFAERRASKRYWALVHGRPQGRTGTLNTLLRRISTPEDGWKMLCEPLPEQEQTPAAPATPSGATTRQTAHPLSRHPLSRKGKKNRHRLQSSRARDADTGRQARTSWRLLASDGQASLLELTLHTGRTHQARAHCAALGTPIIGDRIYGPGQVQGIKDSLSTQDGLYLLAQSLTLFTGEDTPPPRPQQGRHAQRNGHIRPTSGTGPDAGSATASPTGPDTTHTASGWIRATASHPVMARFLAEHPVPEDGAEGPQQ